MIKPLQLSNRWAELIVQLLQLKSDLFITNLVRSGSHS